jgi:hypothetical protein
MPDYTHTRIIPKHPGKPLPSLWCAIGYDYHTGVYAIAHSHAAAMVQTYPAAAPPAVFTKCI